VREKRGVSPTTSDTSGSTTEHSHDEGSVGWEKVRDTLLALSQKREKKQDYSAMLLSSALSTQNRLRVAWEELFSLMITHFAQSFGSNTQSSPTIRYLPE